MFLIRCVRSYLCSATLLVLCSTLFVAACRTLMRPAPHARPELIGSLSSATWRGKLTRIRSFNLTKYTVTAQGYDRFSRRKFVSVVAISHMVSELAPHWYQIIRFLSIAFYRRGSNYTCWKRSTGQLIEKCSFFRGTLDCNTYRDTHALLFCLQIYEHTQTATKLVVDYLE